MKTNNTYTRSSELWKALHDAGLVPDKCLDIVIEAPVGGVVKIHYAAYPGDTLPQAIAAFAESAKVVESVPTAEVTDQSSKAVTFTATVEDDHGIFKDAPGNKHVTLDEMRKAAKPAAPALDSGFAIA